MLNDKVKYIITGALAGVANGLFGSGGGLFLVPLFVSAFRRAGDLAMAMEARCYHGGEGRTRLRVLRYTQSDLWALLATVGTLLATIFAGMWLK